MIFFYHQHSCSFYFSEEEDGHDDVVESRPETTAQGSSTFFKWIQNLLFCQITNSGTLGFSNYHPVMI